MEEVKRAFGKKGVVQGILSFCFLLFIACSCTLHSKNRIAAKIGDEAIEQGYIDRAIEEELYGLLCEIYDVRYDATHKYVGLRLLQQESQAKGVTVESLVDAYAARHQKDSNRDNLIADLVDSLWDKYNPEILLREPVAPRIAIDSALTHSRGNLKSKVEVLELTDYECGMCYYMHKEYDRLLEMFGDRVKFTHSNFSETVTPSSKAALAASYQDKFWEMHDTLMSTVNRADSTAVMNIAMNKGLDMDSFVHDYASEETARQVEANNAYLSGICIRQTPTIVINGRKVRKSNDIEYVIKAIKKELGEQD